MANPVAPDVVHACVVAGETNGFETHYLRAGRGSPVLLLSSDPNLADVLVRGVPRRFRSIAPKLPLADTPRPPEFNPWLRGFLDALGIARVAVVVGPSHTAPALGFALHEPERVSRLVFLLGPCGEWGEGDGQNRGIADRLSDTGHPLLATPIDTSDEAARARALADIVSFLERVEKDQ